MRLILVGGGLANSLIAYRLAQTRPEIDWTILEAARATRRQSHLVVPRDRSYGAAERLARPFLECRWPAYAVAFPGLRRDLSLGYCSVSAERLRDAMAPFAARIQDRRRRKRRHADRLSSSRAEKVSRPMRSSTAAAMPPSPHLSVAYQKFLGLEVRTQQPHGLAGPIIMDATVPQRGRLPVRLRPALRGRSPADRGHLLFRPPGTRCRGDARACAPICLAAWDGRSPKCCGKKRACCRSRLAGDIEAFWAEAAAVPRSGLRAALFHPTTGYSLPHAVRLAEMIASLPDLGAPALFQADPASFDRRLEAAPASTACSTACCSGPPNLTSAIGCWSGSTGFRRG